LQSEIGASRRVLMETGNTGRTEQFIHVKLAQGAEPGSIREIAIVGHDGCRLLA